MSRFAGMPVVHFQFALAAVHDLANRLIERGNNRNFRVTSAKFSAHPFVVNASVEFGPAVNSDLSLSVTQVSATQDTATLRPRCPRRVYLESNNF